MSQFATNRIRTGSFSTIQTPAGSSPVAGSPTDVLTLTSTDGSVLITGNAITDTINFQTVPTAGSIAFKTVTNDFGTSPVALLTNSTLTLNSADTSIYYFSGTAATNTSQLTIQTATTSQSGLLTSTDYTTFNNKIDRPTGIVLALIFG
jgi:hypothetical protein